MVHFVSFNVDGAERAGRAEVLAGTAADTFVLVHGRHLYSAAWTFVVYHLDGSSRAMACAVATTDVIGQHNAILLDPHGMTYMDASLFLSGNGLDGTGMADLAAAGAFGTAVAALKRHRGLHEVHQVGGGTQDVVRATRNTELAGRAMLFQMTDGDRTWRGYGCFPFGCLLVFDDC